MDFNLENKINFEIIFISKNYIQQLFVSKSDKSIIKKNVYVLYPRIRYFMHS